MAEYFHASFPVILQAAASLIPLPCWFDGREMDVKDQTTVQPPTGTNYTPEVKELLRETKGIQDWYCFTSILTIRTFSFYVRFVMYGLTLKLLTMTNVTGRVLTALNIFKLVMNTAYMRSELFSIVSRNANVKRTHKF